MCLEIEKFKSYLKDRFFANLFVVAVKPTGELRRHPVAISIIGAVLVGAVLARFYNVLILVPAFALILAAVLGRAFYFQHGLLRPAVEFALLITSLQIGYVAIPISYVVMVPVRRIRRGKRSGTASPIIASQQKQHPLGC